jgi:hypothetical protein
MINTACRNVGPDAHDDRRLIRGLYEALLRAQITEPICGYRGTQMLEQEFNVLLNSVNRRIEVHSFLSTTTDKNVAQMYNDSTTIVNGMVRVLYEIHGTYQHNMRLFANISQDSTFADEAEVVFMAGSVFRIDEVHQKEHGVFYIRMTVVGDDEDELHEPNN